ncbi:MAG: phosphoesterase [Bacteroidetes bacterium]|nr:MAG: phosphoesterase [Bacteroidota bacterium]
MRIALISDIHEDIESLKKALAMIEREKCDQIICLGDILGFPYSRAKYEKTRDAAACIDLIKRNCSDILLGNHDIFHLKKFPLYHNGFLFPPDWYQLSAEEKNSASNGKVWNYADDCPTLLDESDSFFLSHLPEFLIKSFGNHKVLFSHFVFPNFTGYVSSFYGEGKKLLDHFEFLDQNDCRVSICGHMHMEGMGIFNAPNDGLFSQLFPGFNYFSFGEKKIKNKVCTITIPALADNGQVNGFAIYDSNNLSINAVSLNTNRRFIL